MRSSRVLTEPALSGDTVLLGTAAGALALDGATGATRWNSDRLVHAVAIYDDTAYGAVRWTFDEAVVEHLAVSGERIVAASAWLCVHIARHFRSGWLDV